METLFFVNEKTYFFFEEIELHGIAAFFEFFLPFPLADITNQWIVYDESSLAELEGLLEIEDLEVAEEVGFSEEDKVELLKIISAHDFLKLETDHGTEILDGKKSYHYTLRIDPEETVNLVKEIDQYLAGTDFSDSAEEEITIDPDITDQDLEDLKVFLTKNEIVFDVWIGKKDLLLGKIDLDLLLDDKESGMTLSTKITSVYDRYNEEIDIEEPEGATTLGELIEKITKAYELELAEWEDGLEDF